MASGKLKWPETLNPQQRVERARALVSIQIDNLRELVAISEANRLIIYTPILANQIPRSYAANAFTVFQWSSLNYEILRACAIWDNPRKDRASIPTILALMEEPACLAIVEKELGWDSRYSALQMKRFFRARHVAQLVKASRFHRALLSFRNERVAHNLDFGTRVSPPPTLKYGYERRLLRASIAVINNLNGALRDSSFMFDDAIEQSKRNAEALWQGCTFSVLE